jgi:stress response protein YsnF
MLSEREVSAAIGATAYGSDGDKLGTVDHFFLDDRTGAATWVAVSTGLFGTRRSLIPAAEAVFAEGTLRLPVSRDAVRGAPDVGDDSHLGPADEDRLRRHYGAAGTADPGGPAPAAAAPPGGSSPEEAPPVSDHPGDGGMVRSEERLAVGTETVPTTRVRVVKYVVTEEVQVTVPIRREEIRLEEVPLDAPDPGPGESLGGAQDDAARDAGAAGGGLPEEIVLHAERPVVTVEVVPTERVRLRTEMVAGHETVTGQVQRERVAVDEQPLRRPTT